LKFRTVIDTNVAISSLLFDVRLNNLHLAWRNKLFVMIVSPKMVDEYIKVLAYSKFKLEQFEIYHLVYHEILPFITPVKTKNIRPVIKADPQDDIFLSAGLWGKADYIVSGDKHLLNLGKYNKIKIITPSAFLDIINDASK